MNIVSYQGSKRKELERIKQHEPKKFRIFVDVFGGGANVTLYYLKRNIETIYTNY